MSVDLDTARRHMPTYRWADAPVRWLACPPGELDLDRTLPSGQAFRWSRATDGVWTGVLGTHVVRLTPRTGGLAVQSLPDLPLDLLADYFRLGDDLGRIRRALADEPRLRGALAAQPGLRLLRQPPEETLFSFMCTAANNIPRIRRGIETLARDLGEPIAAIDGALYHAFPTAAQLADCDVAGVRERSRLGWRPARLAEAACVLRARGPAWLPGLRRESRAQVQAALVGLPGVGAKIADCVALFALDQVTAVPVDTHIWQAFAALWRPEWRGLPLTPARYAAVGETLRGQFGELAGWAQQYLFTAEIVPTTGAAAVFESAAG